MWVFLKIGFSYIIVLSLCYGELYLSLHDVVTYVQASRIWRIILPFIHTFALLLFFFLHTFYAYFEVRHPQLEFKWQYRPLVNSLTVFL